MNTGITDLTDLSPCSTGGCALKAIRNPRFSPRAILLFLVSFLAADIVYGEAIAAELTLAWTDNATNEAGFKIERKTGTTGTFTQIAIWQTNSSFYIDSGLLAGTTYCYRVRAYNAAGDSAYSNESCGVAANPQPYLGVGLYNPITSIFYLRNTITAGVANMTFQYGSGGTGWTPLSGDWNSDVINTAGLFDPVTSKFYLRNSNTPGVAEVTFKYGSSGAGWLPLVGDWNGDGRDTVGLYDPLTSQFYLRNSNTAGVADLTSQYGSSGTEWLPLVGDWDGL